MWTGQLQITIREKMSDYLLVAAQNNTYRWVGKALSQLLKFEFQEV